MEKRRLWLEKEVSEIIWLAVERSLWMIEILREPEAEIEIILPLFCSNQSANCGRVEVAMYEGWVD